MMFAAGMGIGLMFYGAAEPLSHFITPPPAFTGHEPQRERPSRRDGHDACSTGPSTRWAIYAIVGLAIAYSSVFRKGRQQLPSAHVRFRLSEPRPADGAGAKSSTSWPSSRRCFGSASSLGLAAPYRFEHGAQLLGLDRRGGQHHLVLLYLPA